MIILALNCGSSSLKYQLYDYSNKHLLAKGIVERIGLKDPIISQESDRNKYKDIDLSITDHTTAINSMIKLLTDKEHGVIEDMSSISAVGHRVVHGGDKFTESVKLTKEIIDTIRSLSYLAPLHNPANIDGIDAAISILPNIDHIAIFDTAFHQSIPEKAYRYAIPISWYEDEKIRRYGFHGTSHLYISKRAAKLLGKDSKDCNLIILHIGNGVSITAIENGLSVDTSMGMTPLEGAIMGTRSGDIDPAIPLFIVNRLKLSSGEVDSILNKESGLLGVTGQYSDRRDIENNLETDKLCKLAMEMECYRLKKYIGMYMAVLGRVDAIVFTAGVGENSGLIRELSVSGLERYGIILDKEKNIGIFSKHGETELSTNESDIKIFMIPTNEEIVFIEDVVGVLNSKDTNHMKFAYSFK